MVYLYIQRINRNVILEKLQQKITPIDKLKNCLTMGLCRKQVKECSRN